MRLDERKRVVLRAIVEDYVTSAEPVGSRTIAKRSGLGVSPATIRNEMSDLEELGLIEQPHTSAGRIPSDRGYRYYVDELMGPPRLSLGEIRAIKRAYRSQVSGVEWLVRNTVKLLTETTRYACVAIGPTAGPSHIVSLQLLRHQEQSGLLLLMTDDGGLYHRLLELPGEIDVQNAQQVVALLSDRLRGVSLSEVGERLTGDIVRRFMDQRRLVDQVVTFLMEDLTRTHEERVFVGGTSHVVGQPEFHDVEKVQALIGLLEEDVLVRRLLEASPLETRVAIGEELNLRGNADLSLVQTSIGHGGRVLMRLGILGPKRMHYGRVLAVLEEVTRSLDSMLG